VLEEVRRATEAFLSRRKKSYSLVFRENDGDVDVVLRDLARFCRAGKTPFDKDPQITALLLGRQEVFLRIQQHLNLSEERLYEIYGGPKEQP